MRPHVALVVLQLGHHRVEIDVVLVAEESVAAEALGAGAGGDVTSIAFHAADRRPVFLQRPRDELRGVVPGFAFGVVRELLQGLRVREVPRQFFDQLFLLSCGRAAVRQELYALTGTDVLEVAARAAAFDIGAFDDQFSQSSSSPY